ncbi:calmodulin binding protein, putative [Ricinus communis]|uniref:Calmodulin binding protein, putative n=1 Tax=Ricinus communis TaxID=3988 RepID=B9S5W4_RICCO|nr:calmodulin binding protein, putative [Ricinus communis]
MITVRSIDFKRKDGEALRTVSFKKKDLDNLDGADGIDDLLVEESICFKKRKPVIQKLKTKFSFKKLNIVITNKNSDIVNDAVASVSLPEPENRTPASDDQRDVAATRLQKAYKSYRTRRNLADCAVVVEELWWKALDYAALRRSSVSFFNSDNTESAVSRWARARTRVAKLGKGLSKDEKAQQLALRHWLEVIDPRHRYGHNLHFYYDVWFTSESSQPFFYWLDVGVGKEVNLDTCPRIELQRQCIKYLTPKEREAYEVIAVDRKLVYRQSGKAVETVEGTKWIFVLSASRTMYVGKKEKGLFQHSSFLAGGAAIAAGRLVAHDGILEAIWSYSGHYRPSEENFLEFISFLEDQNVDLTDVKKCPVDDDIPPPRNREKEPKIDCILRTQKIASFIDIKDVGAVARTNAISNTDDNKEEENGEKVLIVRKDHGIEENIEIPMANSSSEANVDEAAATAVFEISKPISSCKWSTGAGTRIGCVREYPTKLQLQALEHVNLSPRILAAGSSFTSYGPIPSPRPSPNIHLSPTLAYMGLPSPRLHLSTPQ